MVKLSVIQSVYSRNPLILESTKLNIIALEQARVNYEIIIANDKGDIKLKNDLAELLTDSRVKYIYSDINYGKGVCSGGWSAGIPHATGELIHFANQDDVYTRMFYEMSLKEHEDPELMMTHTNAFMVYEDLRAKSLMLSQDILRDYYDDPAGCFRMWFGVDVEGENRVTKAVNEILGPSVIYKRKLHDLIGLPSPSTYLGACDFEYWARILFHGHKCKFIKFPLWLYRISKHSASRQGDVDAKMKAWNQIVQDKYSNLYEEQKKQHA